jgi:serine/threonine protein kinase
VRRKADQARYALKVADVESLGPLEQADMVNEIRCGWLRCSGVRGCTPTGTQSFLLEARLASIQVAAPPPPSFPHRLLASLSHPNLVSFYEAFCDGGKLCIVTELVRGGDLSTLIK